MMHDILETALYAALAIHTLLMGFAVWRVVRGENVIDRLVGVDVLGTLILAILIMLAFVTENSLFIDVALGLAALGFLTIIALSRYLADEQMF